MVGFGKDGKGTIIYNHATENSNLASLTANTIAKIASKTLNENFRVLKARYHFCVTDLTSTNDSDAIMIGLATDDLTVAEILEAVQSALADPTDRVTAERSHRPVWPLGYAIPAGQYDGTNGPDQRYLEGEWTDRWTFGDDAGWCWWAWNQGGTNLSANARIQFLAKIYGVWVK